MIRGMIVAMTQDRVIAVDGKIPWHYPLDLLRFKRITLGQVVIMGSRTFESMNCKPLSNRINIVLTSRENHGYKDVRVKHSLSDAINECEKYSQSFWIIGGARVYQEAMPFIGYIDITIVPNEYSQADGKLTLFPPLPKREVVVNTIYLDSSGRAVTRPSRENAAAAGEKIAEFS